MKRKGFTLIELLICIAIVAILAGLIGQFFYKRNEDPSLIGTNAAGQQTWRVPIDRLPEFQTRYVKFKTVSVAPINEHRNGTTAYLIVIEPLATDAEAEPAAKSE